jgi:phosphatidylglycerol---prolipoprotein diacylglyceryl transferase
MEQSLLSFYQNLPLLINPIALKIGFFSLTWYALMYLVAFSVIYFLLKWRLKNDGKNRLAFLTSSQNLENLFIYLIIGLLIGARLGYALFYEPRFFLENPLALISPFNSRGELVGIYGLSFHGGLLGAILAGLIFVRKNKLNFWELADFLLPAVPAGYFFGRIGNFLNGELFGRMTHKVWGMYFRDENNLILLRHPSQLYEAFFEGVVLFGILWTLRNREKLKRKMLSLYLLGYGVFRLGIEFWRQPDAQIGLWFNFLSLGQIFSLGMILLGLALLLQKIFLTKKTS